MLILESGYLLLPLPHVRFFLSCRHVDFRFAASKSKRTLLVTIICTFLVKVWLQFIHSIAERGGFKHTLEGLSANMPENTLFVSCIKPLKLLYQNLGQIGFLVQEKT